MLLRVRLHPFKTPGHGLIIHPNAVDETRFIQFALDLGAKSVGVCFRNFFFHDLDQLLGPLHEGSQLSVFEPNVHFERIIGKRFFPDLVEHLRVHELLVHQLEPETLHLRSEIFFL